ncbi:NAD(P)/FAD-dependent oxidoreductase [Aliikangiella sp. IMCC44359]|uniref:NAD(P)/FAD-dependent oxidoreductase n=1 Tax=Aliikangiella sp. IMCC44359 TaxID=3459125 RepID=UPI00403AD1DF
MTHPIPDVAVIGAGIIGTCIAERLQHEGKSVILIDKQAPGEGCSKGNAGHFATDIILPLANFKTLLSVPKLLLNPMGPLSINWTYLPKLLPWLTRFAWAAMPHKTAQTIEALKQLNRPSIIRFQHLLKRTKLEALMTQRGALTVFSTPAALKNNRQHQKQVQQHNVNVEQLTGEQVRELEPMLAESIIGGLYYPDTAHSINPHRLVTSLADIFLQQGGQLVKQEVLSIDTSNTQQVTLQTNKGKLVAKEIIIACGAWSNNLIKHIGHSVPLETERGYHLTLPQQSVSITRPVTCYERSFVMTPMEEGLRLAGTVELAGLQALPNYKRAHQLFKHAETILPGIKKNNVSQWMGHRPSLPDSLPIIGRSPNQPSVVFAFGHQHLGLTQAAVTADIVSEIIQQKEPSIDISAYRINRF